jgi:ferritin-like metal-binding protein YciE
VKKIATASQLLLLELGRLLSGEEAILRSLSSVVERARDPRLRNVLEEHRRETRHHISNLSEALHELTGAEESLPAQALGCLDAELESTFARIASEGAIELGDLAVIAASRRIEAYEIASYEAVQLLAARLDAPAASRAAAANLADERRALEALAVCAEEISGRIEVTGVGLPG